MGRADKAGPAGGKKQERLPDTGGKDTRPTDKETLVVSIKTFPVARLMAQATEGWDTKVARTRGRPDFPRLCKFLPAIEAALSAAPDRNPFEPFEGFDPVVCYTDNDDLFILSGAATVIAASAMDKDRLSVLVVDKLQVPEAIKALNRAADAARARVRDEDYESRVIWDS